MSAELFANTIITKLKSYVGADGASYSKETSKFAQRAISEAVTEYLIANTTVSVQYYGILNSSTEPDPVVSDTFNIAGFCSQVDNPSDCASWGIALYNNIASSFTVASPGKMGVIADFYPFNPYMGSFSISQDKIRSIVVNHAQNPLQLVWQSICDDLLTWLNSSLAVRQVVPLPAFRSTISTGTITSIAISVL